MDQRIILLVMSLATFIAYPFLSGDDRKQVAPLETPIDEPEEEEIDDDDEAVWIEDDLQIEKEQEKIRSSITDPQIQTEKREFNSSISDPQMKD